MKVDLIDFNQSSLAGDFDVPDSIFRTDFRPDLMSLVVNWQLAKKRRGTHSCKGISDVSGTTRKPYRQKGTGRARQGSLRSAQFRGGGIIFGPVVRSHAFSLNKKVRDLALRSALSFKASNKAFFVLKDSKFSSPKTSAFIIWMQKFKEFGKAGKSILFVSHEKDENLMMATSNLYNVKVLYNDAVNVYDLLTHDFAVLDQSCLNSLSTRWSA